MTQSGMLNLKSGDAQFGDLSQKIVNVTGATLTVTAAEHKNALITLSRAAGVTVTLPAATGSGDKFEFVVLTAVTSNADIIKVANASDSFVGMAFGVDDDVEGATGYQWNAEPNDDTFSMNGTATGGKRGDRVVVQDVAANTFHVLGYLTQSGGSEATPFTATVS